MRTCALTEGTFSDQPASCSGGTAVKWARAYRTPLQRITFPVLPMPRALIELQALLPEPEPTSHILLIYLKCSCDLPGCTWKGELWCEHISMSCLSAPRPSMLLCPPMSGGGNFVLPTACERAPAADSLCYTLSLASSEQTTPRTTPCLHTYARPAA